MKEIVDVKKNNEIILLAEKIVYAQRPYWSAGNYRQLSLSLMRPRQYYIYDSKDTYPLLIFLCGGGFQKMNRNVWIPELVEYAKRGYVVASLDYSVLPYTCYPEALMDIKEAIRFLKANAERFSIDPNRVAIMGESAGGCLSILTGVTSNVKEYDVGENLKFSSEVQAVVAYYPVTDVQKISNELTTKSIRVDTTGYPNTCAMITSKCPPMYLLHGLADDVVPYKQSVDLYESLKDAKIPCKLTLVQDAYHADGRFYQKEIKERIYEFLNETLNME